MPPEGERGHKGPEGEELLQRCHRVQHGSKLQLEMTDPSATPGALMRVLPIDVRMTASDQLLLDVGAIDGEFRDGAAIANAGDASKFTCITEAKDRLGDGGGVMPPR